MLPFVLSNHGKDYCAKTAGLNNNITLSSVIQTASAHNLGVYMYVGMYPYICGQHADFLSFVPLKLQSL